MKVEDEFQDVLQNIEFAIVSVFRQDNSVLDMNVLDAVNALTRLYEAEDQKRNPPEARLTDRSQKIFDAARKACEWRLGRHPGPPYPPTEDISELNTPAQIVACLKRLRKSIERWSKQGGRQGYLSFVKQYII
jgi:hypothetical protein